MARRGSYPHPIIDAADDVDSTFDVRNVIVDCSQQDVEITYEIVCDDPDLERLLDDGLAMHSLRWHCSATLSTGEMQPEVYRRSPSVYGLRAWIDQELISGDVAVDVRAIASQAIRGHSWKRQHPDYANESFELQVGDVLADGGQFRFNAKKNYDPLDPPIGSCFQFVRSTSRRKRIEVAFDGDQMVDVVIPAETFDDFKLLSHRLDLQISLVVLPALMETLYFMKANRNTDDEPLNDKIWFKTIERLVGEHGGWDRTAFELAQRILENPIDRVMHAGLMAEDD